MKHQTKVVDGRQPLMSDWFCTCGEFGFGYVGSARVFAESHERVANEHDERLEKTDQCIHGGIQRDQS